MNTHFEHFTRLCCSAALSLSAAACLGAENNAASAHDPVTEPLTQVSPAAALSGGGVYSSNAGMLDLLFVIDDAQESLAQRAYLRSKIPEVLRGFTDARLPDGSVNRYRDLHVGVVSTDMGVAGTTTSWPGCNPDGGRDALLSHLGAPAPGCHETYPTYLSFTPGDDADQLLTDFSCISAFGAGCGIAQPLEASLKALWPKEYVDADHRVRSPDQNPIKFLSATVEGAYGHGDRYPNLGFLRNNDPNGLSTLVIILITNNEDCSLRNTQGFQTSGDPEQDYSPIYRCHQSVDDLFDVSRYQRGLKSIRPWSDESPIFAAIVGVPASSVTADARGQVDWSSEHERDVYYDELRNALPDYVVDASKPSGWGIAPSCIGRGADGAYLEAYPPHRMIEVARPFGEDGFVQSVCQDDYAPLASMILQRIEARDKH